MQGEEGAYKKSGNVSLLMISPQVCKVFLIGFDVDKPFDAVFV